MAGLDIREYRGEFEDVVELAHRVWVPEYGGKTWIPLPEAAFLREKFTSEAGALCLVAYEGANLVGSVFSVPRRMRIAGIDYPVSMFTGFTVEPSRRRVALPLIERLRRINETSGAAFGIGMVLDDPTSASYRFWTKYAETYPKSFQFVFRGGYWAKFLRPDAFAKAGIKTWERAASRTAGPLLRLIPRGYDPHVRPYRPSDLERCFELVEKTFSGVDWAMRWPIDQLTAQLGGPAFTTLVYERDGTVEALVNCHTFPLQGRKLIRCAFIDLWAEGKVKGSARMSLVGHLCKNLGDVGVHGVIAPRAATMPSAALIANLFILGAQHFRIGVFPTKQAPSFAPPVSWSFEIT
jgi:hypothetical protein